MTVTLSTTTLLMCCAIGLRLATGYRTFTNETFDILTSDGVSHHVTYHYDEDPLRARVPDYPIHPMLLARRFNYELSGEPIADEELFTLLEAMRWGPSDHNSQPWRVVYAKRDTKRFDEFLQILMEGNQIWAQDAAVLMIIATDMTTLGNISTFTMNKSFATAAAFNNMGLEGTARGYVVHSMAGYKRDRAAMALGIEIQPEFKVEFMVAIGKRVPPSERGMKKKKDKMSLRKKMVDNVSKDVFRQDWLY